MGAGALFGTSGGPKRLVFGRERPSLASWESELLARLQPGWAEVSHAFSGTEVVRIVETGLVDLALVADAPRLDGLSVLRMIRSIDARLPCVLVADGPDRRWLEAALALRAESVFSPPVDVDQMCGLLGRLLGSAVREAGGVQ